MSTEANIAISQFLKDRQVFADLVNVQVYQGKPVLQAEDLERADLFDADLPNEDGQGIRDVLKRYRGVLKCAAAYTDGRAYYLALGVYDRAAIQRSMPVCCGALSACGYALQMERAECSLEHALIPVVILVVHFGESPWDGPLSLQEMYPEDTPPAWLAHLPNDTLNLIDPVQMSPEDLDRYSTASGVHQVFRAIRCAKDKKALTELYLHEEEFQRLPGTVMNVIRACTGIHV